MEEYAAKFLTTRQLARLWQVSEATIKRWADAGHLSSRRTLGGHRRFSLDDVARFQTERGLRVPARAGLDGRAASTRSRRVASKLADETTERFFVAVASGMESAAAELLLEAYMRGVAPVKLFDETLAQVMHRIGRLWHGGEMSVADEHLATRTATRALETLRRSTVQTRPGAPLAVCCAPEEELHELPLLCLQILLEQAGWEVKNFGANTPFFALAEVVGKHRPRLICISSTTQFTLERNAREYQQLHLVARDQGARIVLGGEGFRDLTVRQRFPADLYANNFQELMEFIGNDGG